MMDLISQISQMDIHIHDERCTIMQASRIELSEITLLQNAATNSPKQSTESFAMAWTVRIILLPAVACAKFSFWNVLRKTQMRQENVESWHPLLPVAA